MVLFSDRTELSYPVGYQIYGGDVRNVFYNSGEYAKNLPEDTPTIVIASAESHDSKFTGDPRDFATIPHTKENFDETYPGAIYGQSTKCRLIGVKVYPERAELYFYDGSLAPNIQAVIKDIDFSMTFSVPVGIGSTVTAETFNITSRHDDCYGKPYAFIRRSSEPSRPYRLRYEEAQYLGYPRPTNRFTRWLARMLFPGYEDLPIYGEAFSYTAKLYLERVNEIPLIATTTL